MKKTILFFATLIVSAPNLWAQIQAGTIVTIAGIGASGFSGDGGPATDAQLSYPCTVNMSPDGSLLLCDALNHRIRKYNKSGYISTVAGTTPGFSGDGGPATDAQLEVPQGLSVDTHGNIYVADAYNQRIRRIDAKTGIITTIAGSGTKGFSGDGGPATNASMYNPSGIYATDTAVYFCDWGNDRIRKIILSSGIITTVVGGGINVWKRGDGGLATAAELNGPISVIGDTSGNIYVTEQWYNCIRKIRSDTITTYAGHDGLAGYTDNCDRLSCTFQEPAGLSFNAKRNWLIVSDYRNEAVRIINLATGHISTVAGGRGWYGGDCGPAVGARIKPVWACMDTADNLYIADYVNDRIRQVVAAQSLKDSTITSDGDTLCFGWQRVVGNGFLETDWMVALCPGDNDSTVYISAKTAENNVARIHADMYQSLTGSFPGPVLSFCLDVFGTGIYMCGDTMIARYDIPQKRLIRIPIAWHFGWQESRMKKMTQIGEVMYFFEEINSELYRYRLAIDTAVTFFVRVPRGVETMEMKSGRLYFAGSILLKNVFSILSFDPVSVKWDTLDASGIFIGTPIQKMTVNNGIISVTIGKSPSVYQYDTNTREWKKTLPVSSINTPSGETILSLATDDTALYASGFFSDVMRMAYGDSVWYPVGINRPNLSYISNLAVTPSGIIYASGPDQGRLYKYCFGLFPKVLTPPGPPDPPGPPIQIGIYPNPTSGEITVNLALVGSGVFRITNVLGQTLLKGETKTPKFVIDIGNLPAGMYFIHLNNGEWIERIVKK